MRIEFYRESEKKEKESQKANEFETLRAELKKANENIEEMKARIAEYLENKETTTTNEKEDENNAS